MHTSSSSSAAAWHTSTQMVLDVACCTMLCRNCVLLPTVRWLRCICVTVPSMRQGVSAMRLCCACAQVLTAKARVSELEAVCLRQMGQENNAGVFDELNQANEDLTR